MTTLHPPAPVVHLTARRRLRISGLYVRALLTEFRWTLLLLGLLILLAAVLHAATPQQTLNGKRPSGSTAIYAAWMALLVQPTYSPPQPWYLMAVYSIYPVFGVLLIGEGVVRLALLMMSRRQGEKEWMRVMASTYRDHVILCGLGHLGFRVLEQLVAGQIPVVVLERSDKNLFLSQAKAMHVPVLLRDMKEDQALLDAGIADASAILICSNDDMANLEVALDARRMNPQIRVILRMFDQQLAAKIGNALTIDAAFSSSALAAPVVAAMSARTNVLSTLMIGGIPHVTAELTVQPESALAGKRVDEVETGYEARVLARTPTGAAPENYPSPATVLATGDTLVIHCAASQLPTLAAAGKAGRR